MKIMQMKLRKPDGHHIFNYFDHISLVYWFAIQRICEKDLIICTSISRNLTELNIQDSITEDVGVSWLSCFPENFSSLEILNFSSLNGVVNFDDLERLVSRSKLLRVLKVNESISLDQLQRLLVQAPRLTELGTGSFMQELTPRQYEEIETAFSNCRALQVLSGLWEATSLYLPLLYGACASLTFLNLSDAPLQSGEFAKLLAHCPNLQRLWVRIYFYYFK